MIGVILFITLGILLGGAIIVPHYLGKFGTSLNLFLSQNIGTTRFILLLLLFQAALSRACYKPQKNKESSILLSFIISSIVISFFLISWASCFSLFQPTLNGGKLGDKIKEALCVYFNFGSYVIILSSTLVSSILYTRIFKPSFIDLLFYPSKKLTLKKKKAKSNNKRMQIEKSSLNVTPPISLLREEKREVKLYKGEEVNEWADKVIGKLKALGIEAEIKGVQEGPQYILLEVFICEDVKLQKIKSLDEDLSLALGIPNVRIEAPVLGKDTISIQIPKKERRLVYLSDILGSEEFQEKSLLLPLAIGEEKGGKYVVIDLQKLPHLLIAGATGSGKSVAITCIITSLIFKRTPQQLQFILIDPKRVELNIFSVLPHLRKEVIYSPEDSLLVLQELNSQLEGRYRLLSTANCQDITSYNISSSSPLPYIVVIIDELADLVLSRGNTFLPLLMKLAQMARAVGIHLVVATQRPSVDVITGVIKANFPARMAFKVSSRGDSRTILDTSGAEQLLGCGDMLLKLPYSQEQKRIQGAFISREELTRILNFFKER